MAVAGVNIVELGLLVLKNSGFKGASAYTTDHFINSLHILESLTVSVIVNAAELVGDKPQINSIEQY